MQTAFGRTAGEENGSGVIQTGLYVGELELTTVNRTPEMLEINYQGSVLEEMGVVGCANHRARLSFVKEHIDPVWWRVQINRYIIAVQPEDGEESRNGID